MIIRQLMHSQYLHGWLLIPAMLIVYECLGICICYCPFIIIMLVRCLNLHKHQHVVSLQHCWKLFLILITLVLRSKSKKYSVKTNQLQYVHKAFNLRRSYVCCYVSIHFNYC